MRIFNLEKNNANMNKSFPKLRDAIGPVILISGVELLFTKFER